MGYPCETRNLRNMSSGLEDFGSDSQSSSPSPGISDVDTITSSIENRDTLKQDTRQNTKKQKLVKKSASQAISELLTTSNSLTTRNDASKVILSRRHAPERRLAEQKLELAAKKLLRNEKQKRLYHAHTDARGLHEQAAASVSLLVRERLMRKMATKGIVQIFNAVHARAVEREERLRAAKESHAQLVTQMVPEPAEERQQSDLKRSFLDLLKASMGPKQ
jgi:hypothetical protein